MILFDRESRQYADTERGITAKRGNSLDRNLRRYVFRVRTPARQYELEVFDQVLQDVTAFSIDLSLREKRGNWKVEIGPNPEIALAILAADVELDQFRLDSEFASIAKEALFATFYNTYGAQALAEVPFVVSMGRLKPQTERYLPPSEYFEGPSRVSYPVEHVSQSIGNNAGYEL